MKETAQQKMIVEEIKATARDIKVACTALARQAMKYSERNSHTDPFDLVVLQKLLREVNALTESIKT